MLCYYCKPPRYPHAPIQSHREATARQSRPTRKVRSTAPGTRPIGLHPCTQRRSPYRCRCHSTRARHAHLLSLLSPLSPLAATSRTCITDPSRLLGRAERARMSAARYLLSSAHGSLPLPAGGAASSCRAHHPTAARRAAVRPSPWRLLGTYRQRCQSAPRRRPLA